MKGSMEWSSFSSQYPMNPEFPSTITENISFHHGLGWVVVVKRKILMFKIYTASIATTAVFLRQYKSIAV